MIINLNGEILDQTTAKIPAASPAFLNGFGIFETLRTYNQKLFHPEEHLQRLSQSARAIGLVLKWIPKRLQKELEKTLSLSDNPESHARVVVTQDDLIIYVKPLKEKPEYYYCQGVELVSYAGHRSMPSVKKIGDLLCFLANQHAKARGAYEAVLVDPLKYVHECAYANIFWADGGELYTTRKEILFGITRDIVIRLAGECFYMDVSYRNLLLADEVFITQTSSGILPVVAIDGQRIGNGKPGSMTSELMKKFNALVWKS
ncbi:aminotransferase class IV family protein [Candidatus Peregrinibacteria bacterium]|nr:aminotransferase class IV family protein [Candidatus Peregrinibacteria bacterium]